MKVTVSKVIAYLIGSVVLLEIIGRMLYLVPVTPPASFFAVREVVGRFHEPYDYFLYSPGDEYSTWVQLNYHSLRDIEHNHTVPPDVTRILFLGDSVTAGWEVALSKTYVSQLRTLTNNQPYEYVNAGFLGWGTDKQYLYYTVEGRRYNSDVVVLQIQVDSDVIDNGIGVFQERILADGRPVITHPLRKERPYFTLDDQGELVSVPPRKLSPTREEQIGGIRSFLYHHSLAFKTLSSFSASDTSENTVDVSSPFLEVNRIPIDYYAFSPESLSEADWQQAWDITTQLIRSLQEEVEADGGEFYVLLVDSRWEQDPDGWARLQSEWQFEDGWSSAFWGEQYRQFFRDNEIPYLDMLPVLRAYNEASEQAIIFQQDGHWTAVGHCVVAVALQNWFVDLGIFESAQPLAAQDVCG
jgi:hypothetical protein